MFDMFVMTGTFAARLFDKYIYYWIIVGVIDDQNVYIRVCLHKKY